MNQLGLVEVLLISVAILASLAAGLAVWMTIYFTKSLTRLLVAMEDAVTNTSASTERIVAEVTEIRSQLAHHPSIER